jgi:hypothetical protein
MKIVKLFLLSNLSNLKVYISLYFIFVSWYNCFYLGRFEINPEAEEFLHSLKDVKLGVVAVCGKYRTGKSYLLNKLFIEDNFSSSTK